MIEQATLQFLKKLAQHNYREWFHAHREEYDSARGNVIAVATQLLEEINRFDPLGFYDVRKSMFRIARDTRFTHDKSPYKQNFGVILNAEGNTRSPLSGYYLHVEPGKSFVSCGLYMPPPNLLKAVRRIIDEDFDIFKKIISKKEFRQTFIDLARDDDALSRVPTGFDKNSPAAEYLKLKHFYVMVELSDREITAATFVKKAARYYSLMKPFNNFLNDIIRNYEV
ncbi:MAG: DUF2461 domain-containing protein [Prevotellaceae bacterium]|jgi:uncharacterized protein (TIGR02453 family)|nr:DUF2461 domain-containing protein [Prevotellaceae bacterium]